MKWIKHDTDANQDAKLQNVLLDYGLEGYGLYWYCVELIAGKVDKDNITFELEHDARIIARNVGSTAQRVEEMMRYFVEVGLFENAEGIITCLKLAKRLDQSMTSNPAMRHIIQTIKNHDGVMTGSDNNHDEVMQDKIRLDKNKNTVVKQSSKKPVPYQLISDSYNSILGDSFHRIQKVTDKRKGLIRKFYSNMDKDLDKINSYFEYFRDNATPFHRGDNNRNWKAGFEYIIREDTVQKCREDNL